ncbi:ferredoxin [candidate division GN15 bacterium]|uniref:Ferredoxin n=1 Tax=candidate division GN15 bacterium TaxID=2072418 RepID=A0A855XCE9_9BACT|nr:MAG: ferredoxin [candidate division GN15 bacterium]
MNRTMEAATLKNISIRRKSERKGVQTLRLWAQLISLGVNVWIGVQFYLWVKYIQNGAVGTEISRPPGVEGWLPIGSLVSLRHFLGTGTISMIHPAGLIILVTIIFVSFIFKKGFCAWVCPIGFISEMLGDISDRLFGRRIKPPKWLDYPLRSLKYLLLAFFIWAILIMMSPRAIESFLNTDYNVISDVLMLRFFTHISMFALAVIAALFLLSLVVRGFWCRYLCPYGALLGIFSLISPTRIRRNAASCIDCNACAKVCPAFIKVDKVKEVVSDECLGCMACVDSCPVKNTLLIHPVRRKFAVSSRAWAAALLIVFWGTLLGVKFFGPWQNSISKERYIQYMPGVETGQYQHPMP